MPLDQKAVVKQIDEVVAETASTAGPEGVSTNFHILLSAVRRLAPSGSSYTARLPVYESVDPTNIREMSGSLQPLRGMLQALRSDYEAGRLQSVVELVHADIFADFLEMADYLLQQKYKDAAAVITGSVLEAHLRKLCLKNNIDVLKTDGSPKKPDALNSELVSADVYSKLDLKGVIHWLGLRNDAAHGNYNAYTKEQVGSMIDQVRDFFARHPA